MTILAVVVLYKVDFAASPTACSLRRIFSASPEILSQVKVLVWDNSPEPLPDPTADFPYIYRHSSSNVGISGAYNSAASYAREHGFHWLLLLDQDTELPQTFISNMLQHVEKLNDHEDVAAIVPTVFVKDFTVSPRRMLFNRHVAYPAGESGIAEGEPAAINSASLLRVKHLLEVGGYSEAFWLDYSDWYVFHQFFLHNKKVWRAAEIQLQHSMTVMDYDNLMSEWRYENFLEAEGAFNDLYKGRCENAIQTVRLFARTFRQRRRFKNPAFSHLTWKHFVKRLTTRRSKRILRWNALNAVRMVEARKYHPCAQGF